MNIPIFNATIRNEKVKKIRKQGCTPAVIYGKSIESTPIQMDTMAVLRLLRQNGDRTRIKLKMEDTVKIGILKAVDIDPITSEIRHLDIQIIEENEVVNWEIPIIFTGRENMESKRLLLQINLPQIKVTGNANTIPDFIKVDVSNKNADETITIADLNLPAEIETLKPSETILAMIKKK